MPNAKIGSIRKINSAKVTRMISEDTLFAVVEIEAFDERNLCIVANLTFDWADKPIIQDRSFIIKNELISIVPDYIEHERIYLVSGLVAGRVNSFLTSER